MKRNTLRTLARLEEAYSEDARRLVARASEALEEARDRYRVARQAIRNHRRENAGADASAPARVRRRPAAAFLLDRARDAQHQREGRRLADSLDARRRELRKAAEAVDRAHRALRSHAATHKALTQRAEQTLHRLRSGAETQRADEADDLAAARHHRFSRRSAPNADSTEP